MDSSIKKTVASAIYRHLKNADDPPVDDLYIPLDKMHEEEGNIIATVRYVMEYCGRKIHTVHIKFPKTPNYRFDPKNYSYV